MDKKRSPLVKPAWTEKIRKEDAVRVLMVGSGPCQIHGIRALQKRGIYVIAADYHPWTEGKALAQEAITADAFDAQAITAAAKAHRVHGILTMGTDQPVYCVQVACTALGLPHDLSVETARMVTHKKAMKERLQERGVPVVPWRLLSKGSAAAEVLHDLPGPYVLKPVDSQGQRGIFKVEDASLVQQHLEETLSYSREEYALVETYYPSNEITVSGWVQEGALQILTVTDRLCFHPDEHLGVCIAHRYPSHHARGIEKTVEKISQDVCQALEIGEGPFYLQLLVGEEGVMVNEAACRLGGAYEDITIPLVTGVDVLNAVIDRCLGVLDEKIDVQKAPQRQEDIEKRVCTKETSKNPLYSAFFTKLFFCRRGVVAEAISLEEFKALPFIVDAGFHFQQGSVFGTIESAVQRAGWFIVAGKDEEEVNARLQQAQQALKIQNLQGESLLLPF